METVSIQGQVRDKNGKEAAKKYRSEGLVPCVLYSKGENVQFSVKPADLKSLVFSPDFKVAQIDIQGQNHRCILKEIQ